jgi:hypothetical protein
MIGVGLKYRCYLTLFAFFLFLGCSVEIPKEDFVAYYDKKCKTEKEHSGIIFFAIALSPDYEKAKWGVPLDSGMRVVVGATPRSDLSFESSILINGADSSVVVLQRKMKTFELGSADMFVLSFADRMDGAKLRLKNVSRGIGNVEIELKDCRKIRLKENKQ